MKSNHQALIGCNKKTATRNITFDQQMQNTPQEKKKMKVAKKQYQYLIILVTILSGSIQAYSQDNFIPNVVAPSPNAEALGKYGEVPVDLYRGLPNINIPLYNISVDDIQVPISLSFHASGHKVGETASWVGLHWSLNSGGVVTRSMRGKPDEGGYLGNIGEILGWSESQKAWIFYLDVNNSDPGSEDVKEEMNRLNDDKYDTEADLFFFNYPGGSGKFQFASDQSIVMFPTSNTKVIPNLVVDPTGEDGTNAVINSFTLKDENGLVYTFDKEEVTRNITFNADGNTEDDFEYESSWFLGQISSQRSGRSVAFTYSEQIEMIQHSVRTDVITETMSIIPDNFGNEDKSFSISQGLTAVNSNRVHARYLDEISWEGGKIKFEYSANREDIISGGQRLDYVEILDYNGALIKKYRFDYDYFTSGLGSEPKNKALRLLAVTEISPSGSAKPPYIFQYCPGSIPSVDSNSVDHFGFYNGVSNNTRVPGFTRYNTVLVNGANREPVSGESKVGMLSSIIYPTGGSTEFKYEAHTLFSPESFRDTPAPNVYTAATVATAQKCNPDGTIDDNGTLGLTCANFSTSTIAISHSSAYNLKWEVSTMLNGGANMPSVPSGTNDLKVELYEQTASGNVLIDIHKGISDITRTFFLEKGKTYIIEATSNIVGAQITGRISYQWVETNIPAAQVTEVFTGGVRIESITNKDANGTVVGQKRYEYYKEGTKHSSGVSLAYWPVYENEYATNSNPDEKTYIKSHTAYPNGMLGAFNGSHVVYTTVQEIEDGNGSTQYKYSYIPDGLSPSFNSDGAYYSKLERNSKFWRRGQLLEKKVFDEENNLLSKEQNTYSYIPMAESISFGYEMESDNDNNWPYHYQYSYGFSSQTSGWARLDSTKLSTYAGGQELTTSTAYTYGLSNTYLPTVINNDYADEISKTEYITYLNDQTNHVINPLVDKKQVNKDLEQITRTNITYTNFKPTSIRQYDQNNTESSNTTLSNFNGLKPSYIQDSRGNRSVYLWAYNDVYPVVKAENIDYSTLQAAVVSAAGTSNLDNFWENYNAPGFDKVAWKNFNTALRNNTNLANAIVSTYTYDPLVGMTSQTDPNGLTIYYEYDQFNRLEYIKDDVDDIVSRQSYNYQFNPELTISTNSIGPSYASGSTNITVTTNTAWNLNVDNGTGPSGWLSASATSNYNDGVVTITYTANGTTVARTGTVTVSGGGISKAITITQQAAPPSLSVSPGSISPSSSSGSTNVSVTSNIAWTVVDNASWITLSAASGTNNGTINISYTQNTGAARTGTVTFSGAGVGNQTVSVNQAVFVPTISTSSDNITVNTNSSDSFFLTVTSNSAWEIYSYPSWIDLPNSGSTGTSGTTPLSFGLNSAQGATGSGQVKFKTTTGSPTAYKTVTVNRINSGF